MKQLMWLLLIATTGALAYALWLWRNRWIERRRAGEERFTKFLEQARPVPPASAPAAPSLAPAVSQPKDESLPVQRLLFEAAAKAGQAGEPALAIQLCARLLVRYPDSPLAAQARAAVEEQKRKLAKP